MEQEFYISDNIEFPDVYYVLRYTFGLTHLFSQ